MENIQLVKHLGSNLSVYQRIVVENYCYEKSKLQTSLSRELGVEAQNNEDPKSFFSDHGIVIYNEKIYDPSYGTGPFNNFIEWEDESIAGHGLIVIINEKIYFYIYTNDPKGVQNIK